MHALPHSHTYNTHTHTHTHTHTVTHTQSHKHTHLTRQTNTAEPVRWSHRRYKPRGQDTGQIYQHSTRMHLLGNHTCSDLQGLYCQSQELNHSHYLSPSRYTTIKIISPQYVLPEIFWVISQPPTLHLAFNSPHKLMWAVAVERSGWNTIFSVSPKGDVHILMARKPRGIYQHCR